MSYAEQLSAAMTAAKQAHSKLPKWITNDPEHKWEDWYAEYMIKFFPHLLNLK